MSSTVIQPLRAPERFAAHERITLAHAMGSLFLGAGILGLVALAMPHAGRNVVGLAGCIAASFVTGGAMLCRPDHVRRLPLALAWATGLITAALWFDGAASAYGLLYVWVALVAFYFLPTRLAVLEVALASALFALALATIDGVEGGPQRWLMMFGTVAATGGLIVTLRRRADEAMDRLAQAARTDPLTGLLNRRAFDEELAEELDRARRGGDPVSLVLLDLDRLKDLNDEFGHDAGDRALQRLAQVMVESKRGFDLAVRLGGDEFALVLSRSTPEHATRVAERVRAGVAADAADEGTPLTASVGIAGFPDDARDAAGLIAAADRALYAAKRAGRDRVEPADGRRFQRDSASERTTAS